MALRRVEQRGGEELRTVQVERDVFERLQALAQATGKPIRWHMERALRQALGDADDGYAIADFATVAASVRQTLAPDATLIDAVAAFNAYCDAHGIRRPHPQTARKHLRDVVAQSGLKGLTKRVARCFTTEEDELISAMRQAGNSLSVIGGCVDRRANVILRRLRALQGDA
jgi:predicted transcriptional regulator